MDEVTIEEKGILHPPCCGRRPCRHGARPWQARNALEALIDGLSRVRQHFETFRDASHDHWYPTCSVNVVHVDNDTVNRIPPMAEAMVDIRFPPPHTMGSMLALVRDLIGKELRGEDDHGRPATHLAPDQAYLDTVRELTRKQPEMIRESGGSDARFLCLHGIPVIMARPDVGDLHAEDEWIDIDSMVMYLPRVRTLPRKAVTESELADSHECNPMSNTPNAVKILVVGFVLLRCTILNGPSFPRPKHVPTIGITSTVEKSKVICPLAYASAVLPGRGTAHDRPSVGKYGVTGRVPPATGRPRAHRWLGYPAGCLRRGTTSDNGSDASRPLEVGTSSHPHLARFRGNPSWGFAWAHR